MKEKKILNQNSFLLLVTILLFFVMYAIGCVLFNAQGFAKTQNFLNLFISNAGLIVIGIGMTIVMITHSRSIAQTADRVLQVSDGVLTDFGRCAE